MALFWTLTVLGISVKFSIIFINWLNSYCYVTFSTNVHISICVEKIIVHLLRFIVKQKTKAKCSSKFLLFFRQSLLQSRNYWNSNPLDIIRNQPPISLHFVIINILNTITVIFMIFTIIFIIHYYCYCH